MTLKWIKDWVKDLVKGWPEREQQQQRQREQRPSEGGMGERGGQSGGSLVTNKDSNMPGLQASSMIQSHLSCSKQKLTVRMAASRSCDRPLVYGRI
jgi:hypothetical protein